MHCIGTVRNNYLLKPQATSRKHRCSGRGYSYSPAKRVIQTGADHIRFKKDILFTGGAARNTGMVKATKGSLGGGSNGSGGL
jgi:hypothetical protein